MREIKKSICYLCILCLLIMSGCSNRKGSDDSKETTTGIMNYSLYKQSISQSGVLTYYNSFLEFYDFKTNQAVILCDKPNCMHNTSECNAFKDFIANVAFFYQDSLYYFSQDSLNIMCLYKADKNGMNERMIISDIPVASMNDVLLTKQGKLYFIASTNDIIEDEDGEVIEINQNGMSLVVVDLNKDTYTIPFTTHDIANGRFLSSLNCYDDEVYAIVTHYNMDITGYNVDQAIEEENEEEIGEENVENLKEPPKDLKMIESVIRINSKDESEIIWSKQYESYRTDQGCELLTVSKNELYFYNYKKGISSINVTTGEEKTVLKTDEKSVKCIDNEFILYDNSGSDTHTFKFYTLDGKECGSGEFDAPRIAKIDGSLADRYVFLLKNNENPWLDKMGWCYKDDLKKGKTELHKMNFVDNETTE